ncbi:XRE family transcriptional regulator [Streptomyces sp. Marseille-Q5077]|uniref:XRE family transcriptional regulator n=1 Tax=Streptomyces sp. Marseille-Q5077 TaxID=3418995 RepID=UPI003D0795C1
MMPSPVPERSDGAPLVARRGRKPEPIAAGVGLAHRAWLESVRARLRASGLTLDDLVTLTGFSKTRISELLRGNGYYPGWEITFSIIKALEIPAWPMRRLWTAAAQEADKQPAWIQRSIDRVVPIEREHQPTAHQGFVQLMAAPYTAYARAFLLTGRRAQWVVAETFDILWLCWDEVAASENVPRSAWLLLRARVMARAHRHPEGHVDLRAAALSAQTQLESTDLAERLSNMDELVPLFDAIGRLPRDQQDITVLRHLCGIDAEVVPDVVGLTPAATRAVDGHARAALADIYRRRQTRE